ncbi:MAG: AMP-dependent synthetase, partial [Deltaproteobacteria bacterium]
DFYLPDLKATALIVQSEIDSPAKAVAQRRGIPVIELTPMLEAEAGIFTLTAYKGSRPIREGFAEAEDVALVLHTSGTTSRPKMVPLTQKNLLASANHIGTTLELTEKDRCLNIMPLFHIHALVGAVLASLMAGASVVCTSGFDAEEFFTWLGESHPTWYTAVPTIHQAALSCAAAHKEQLQRCSLRFIRSSSAALPPQVMQGLEEVFQVPVIEAYGMTEASHQISSNPLPPRPRRPGSVGISAGPEVAIMDEAGKLLSSGKAGEIVIRGANVMSAYANGSEANRESFTRGWFRTGDEGYLDADGYLFITGRLKEIINRGGEKISPREVDEVLMQHPAVSQAVTFAVPHSTLGEDVAAAVVQRAKMSVTEGKIQRFAAMRLAEFKIPRQVLIVQEIPKSATGKVERIGLAEELGL